MARKGGERRQRDGMHNMYRHSSILLPLVFAASAWASEGEGAKGNPFAGDIGNALWTLIIFLIVVVVLGKFAWGPILAALQRREDFINASLADAKREREEAEKRLAEYTEKLAAAHREATAVVEEGRRDAEALQRRLEDEAKAEAQAILERAKREIGIATETAVKELYTLSAKLATDLAARVIRKQLDPKEHERLIEASIEDLEKLGRRN